MKNGQTSCWNIKIFCSIAHYI